MGMVEQPARTQNIKAIADFYRSGIKDTAQAVGIELEHTLTRKDGTQVAYHGDFGAEQLLEAFADDFPEPMMDGATIVGRAGRQGTVTLEPAAQFELSAGPFRALDDAAANLSAFEGHLRALCEAHDIRVETPGYNPYHRAIDLELIPKRRYAMMNEYLGALSMFGVCMMRGSASTQVSIDYHSEQDCLRKLRLTSACAPLFALICDNAPVFETKPRTHQLVRTKIWQHCDPDRCGIVPGVFDRAFTLEEYAAYVLDTPAIVEQTPHGERFTTKTFGEIFSDTLMDVPAVEHAVSMLFNDVRLKTYLEIRPADAMPAAYVLAYTALIKGLFYNNASLDALDSLFDGVDADACACAKDALMQSGYHATVYQSPVSVLADELMSIATTGLSDHERPYLAPLAELVADRTTLADRAERERGL
ncbi:glutamate-cysteine ligase family protein [Adlercreutzia murintestinalis]|uniref:glutamate-cysteine ligase family protein n=1 Tax=Adlercreutzia murintestinalis TaxID=2941325 RepID=UPI002040CD94|nr:glutamate-cysteine ligase family protein [Adlercreutzia murintestinalis]